ncbi:unnamed protein product [Soboliphyme baturini]|uniref:protein-serine/threonine phosphatase n=1 Tax=Soboliphyme baturini TaxID=241478 RepID=A0A183IEE4_9BILA|nr:unnamed protein product [Soboliphyme baturini]
MGVYLSAPVTEKRSSSGENEHWSYGATSMQGWRIHQEDAHNCILNFDNNCAFFAVYDGHGGSEVAEYSCENFPEFLKSLDIWKGGKLGQALEDAFLKFDQSLMKPEVLKELKLRADANSAAKKTDESLEIDDAEKHMLLEECHLPLDQLLQKYLNAGIDKNVLQRREDAFEGVVNERISSFPPCEKVEETETVLKTSNAATKRSRDSATECLKNHSNKNSDSPRTVENGPVLNKRVKIEGEQSDKSNSELQSVGNEKLPSNVPGDGDADCLFGGDKTDRISKDNEASVISPEIDEHLGFSKFHSLQPGIDSGTTACVLVLKDNIAYCANAGDSRCVLCRDGVAIQMSVDHKPEDETERQRIVNAGGKVTMDGRVNGGLNLSRALGDHFYKRNSSVPLKDQMISPLPDVFVQTVKENKEQFFVLACDGIWNAMENQEVIDFIRLRMNKGASLKEICEQLCDACLSQNTEGDGTGCDNMTVVIVMAKNHSNAA